MIEIYETMGRQKDRRGESFDILLPCRLAIGEENPFYMFFLRPASGSTVTNLGDQFQRLPRKDRFWYWREEYIEQKITKSTEASFCSELCSLLRAGAILRLKYNFSLLRKIFSLDRQRKSVPEKPPMLSAGREIFISLGPLSQECAYRVVSEDADAYSLSGFMVTGTLLLKDGEVIVEFVTDPRDYARTGRFQYMAVSKPRNVTEEKEMTEYGSRWFEYIKGLLEEGIEVHVM